MNNRRAGHGRTFQSGMCSILLLTVPIFFGFSISLASDTFIVNKDQSILADNNLFADMNEYVLSDYFRENGLRCGTKRPDIPVDQQQARSVDDCSLQLTRIQNEYWLSGVYISVPIWIHVIYRSDGVGNISDSAINAQVNALNEDFRAISGTLGSQGFDTKIKFTLAGITRTKNDVWFNDGDIEGYTAALNKDPSMYVNVYTNTASGNLGYATLPQEAAGQSADRIVIHYSTVGGRYNGNLIYDQGRTLVHEMGHYMGLYHTFDEFGTCNNSYSTGDLIVDTPSENVAHHSCVREYTCGTPDPIHNYMNYTPDSCMMEFTREQANRMVCSLVNFRPGMNIQKRDGAIVPPFLTPLLLGN